MTLELYSPERLDQLTLRLLDLAAKLRGTAQEARSQGLTNFAVHDKKALEWIGRLEEWSQKTCSDLDIQMIKNRAAKLAAERA